MKVLIPFMGAMIVCCGALSLQAEPELEGDQRLREMVLDAVVSNEGAAIRKGHWIGTVFLGVGNANGEFLEEGGGPLELIWEGEKTYGKYSFKMIDRFPPQSSPTIEHEFVVRDGVHTRLSSGSNNVSQQPMSGRFNRVPERARMRPDEAWFRCRGRHRWSWLLSLDESYFPNVTVARSEARRLPDGLIQVQRENSIGARYLIEADPNQGLNIVRWTWTYQDRQSEGSATWKQTPTGVWYPSTFQFAEFDVRVLKAKLELTTTSFDSEPVIPRNRFDWTSIVPQGARMDTFTDRGKTLKSWVIGNPAPADPLELLDRLGEKNKDGFAKPERGER